MFVESRAVRGTTWRVSAATSGRVMCEPGHQAVRGLDMSL